MELLSGFEPETSSLPTDWKPGNCWCSAVSGPFCFGKMMFSVLSAPLVPSAFFAVWVRLWVSAQFATWRTGLTRLNFMARSGVVSGQSSSKVMGMVLARSNSFNSSDVKINSFFHRIILKAQSNLPKVNRTTFSAVFRNIALPPIYNYSTFSSKREAIAAYQNLCHCKQRKEFEQSRNHAQLV